MMKTATLLLTTALGLSLFSAWAVAGPQTAPPGPGLPPPALGDAGVDTAAAPAASNGGSPMAPPAVALPSMRDAGAAAPNDAVPEVTIHQRGGDSVQEYRRSGQLYMVVVTPKNGIPYSYMLDPQGRWVDEHGQKPVRPVMYKILEWGKSKPATARSSGD